MAGWKESRVWNKIEPGAIQMYKEDTKVFMTNFMYLVLSVDEDLQKVKKIFFPFSSSLGF